MKVSRSLCKLLKNLAKTGWIFKIQVFSSNKIELHWGSILKINLVCSKSRKSHNKIVKIEVENFEHLHCKVLKFEVENFEHFNSNNIEFWLL